MTPLLFVAVVSLVSLAAGFLGALLGLGGGLIVVPVLTLLLHVDIRLAIGASIISVIATSSGAAAAYVREHLANIRVAMFLELGTASGAIVGAYLAGLVHPRWLYVLFGAMLGYSAVAMLRGIHAAPSDEPPGPVSEWLRLNGSYFDHVTGETVEYPVRRPLLGLGMMVGAGTVSGLLGVGSGALKVPAMDLGMGLPMKVSTATSNLMIGVTAAASAGLYFARGQIDPFIAAPVALGVLTGALLGSRALKHVSSERLRRLFVVVLVVVCAQMIWKGIAG
ncbi:MAG TPA: sulfite exporter TauE/SafE family protein [Thermoanaerobaculia bacterium]|nr:sulfite exporter TauE/SafE family protein [Thermoanaerobaculia bacterium]